MHFKLWTRQRKSFWKKLFGSDKKKKTKKKKFSSLSNSSYEIKDERFNSVVLIKTKSGLGSGFFISKDEVLTNYHVIEGATNISIINQNKKRSSAVILKLTWKRFSFIENKHERKTSIFHWPT